MHKEIIISGDPATVRQMGASLRPLDDVIGLAVQVGASIKPAGDVLTVQVLNRGADEVLRLATQATREGRIDIVICSTNAFIAADRDALIGRDIDEALWEEMESGLRNHGRVSPNYLLLMMVGGMIAAVGLFLEPVGQATAVVAASIIAPGFEPVAKICQGIVLRRRRMVGLAIVALLVGYATMIGAAALAVSALAALGQVSAAQLLSQPLLPSLTTIAPRTMLISACAAIAGMIMVVSLRDTYVVGPLIALVLITGSGLVGAALGLGKWSIALRALGRVGLDIALVMVLGVAVFLWKQKRVHHRDPVL
jgi:hypothetical protein